AGPVRAGAVARALDAMEATSMARVAIACPDPLAARSFRRLLAASAHALDFVTDFGEVPATLSGTDLVVVRVTLDDVRERLLLGELTLRPLPLCLVVGRTQAVAEELARLVSTPVSFLPEEEALVSLIDRVEAYLAGQAAEPLRPHGHGAAGEQRRWL